MKLSVAKLEEAMGRKGIRSYSELSRKSGVHRNTIYPLISGKHSPFSRSFLGMCKALEVTPDSLLNQTGKSTTDSIREMALAAEREFSKEHPSIVFFLFGSRVSGRAKQFSDYDIGLSGGVIPIDSMFFLDIKEFFAQAADDLPVKLDVLNFDAAPSNFILDFDSPVEYLAGSKESLVYLRGKFDGIRKGS